MPFCIAIAEPDIPAISAWLSLVGIPNHHASTAQNTIANIAAVRAVSAACELLPKSTILYIVSTTVELIRVISNTPRKLNIAANNIDFLGESDLVETQVAIAFGASVQPFTSITPNINEVIINNFGFAIISFKNSAKVMVIYFLP